MIRSFVVILCLLLCSLGTPAASILSPTVLPGTPKEWGATLGGRANALDFLGTNCIKLSANAAWSMGLRSDGTIVAWGTNNSGQTNSPTGDGFSDSSCGWKHGLAIKNGQVYEWGLSAHLTDGWPDASAAATNSITTAVTVEGGDFHSIALLANKTVEVWGIRAECFPANSISKAASRLTKKI